MTREDIQRAIFLEMHKEIGDAVAIGLQWLGSSQQGTDVPYPPGECLTAEEKLALENLKLSPVAQSALAKIMTDTASAPLFHLFSLMDGVSDPESGDFEFWPGLDFVEKNVEPNDEEVMLHDEFYGSYWDYKSG
jgi:hypothetical protein